MGESRVPSWLTKTTYAHRGLHAPKVPENSVAAAQAAIARGLGIECDIQRSLDGQAMVFHDWELERLTQAQGPTERCPAHALERLNLLGTPQNPVTLERFLSVVDGRVPLLIEIKSRPDYDVEPTVLSVARQLETYTGPHAIMSFDPRVSAWLASHAPEICRGIVGTDSLPNGFENVWRDWKTVKQAKPDFLALDRRDLSHAEATAWRAAQRPLLSWTIRTREEANLANALADALIAEGEVLA